MLWFDVLFVVIFLGLEVAYYRSFGQFRTEVLEALDKLSLETRQLHQDPEYVKELFKDRK